MLQRRERLLVAMRAMPSALHEGIPVTAVFFAPDYYGSPQYAQYFGMFDGTVCFKRSGAAKDRSMARPEEAKLLEKALATGGEESVKAFSDLAQSIAEDCVIGSH